MPNPKTFSISALATRLAIDRRTLSNLLESVRPAGRRAGNPVYRLNDVERVVAGFLSTRSASRTSRERLNIMQAEKIAAQIAILKRDWLPAEMVRQWGSQLGFAVKRVVETLHLEAPSLAGLDVPELAQRLKAVEQEIMRQLSTLDERIAEFETAPDDGRSVNTGH